MATHEEKPAGLMRSLGRFFGHVAAGVRSSPQRREISRDVEERQVETPSGRVTLRRTVIEEIEIERDSDESGEPRP
ncbi:MAG: hypothetical protein Kow0022_11970 [Phycisphaerales bacterium]